MRENRWLPFFVASLLAAPLVAQSAAPLPDDRAAGAAAIDGDDLRAWLTELTSAECAGRATGTDGFLNAATLVRGHFERLGLEPAFEGGSYWQQVPWTRLQADAESSYLEVRRGDRVVCRLSPGDGLHGEATSSAGARGALALVEVAGDALDELRDLDLVDKIALAWAPGGRVSARQAGELRRARPAALILVDDGTCARFPSLAGRSGPGAGAANRAVRGRGRMPNRLYTTSERLREVLAARDGVEGGAPAELTAELQINVLGQDAPAYNVAAILRGTDPELSSEFVVVGSHLDHLGERGGQVYPGADDDGSGSVGVMAVAQAFARNPHPPRRSVLFVTFCGEEVGLVGSDFFARNPPVPLSSMVAELQMDMIGRRESGRGESADDNADSLHLIGTEKLSEDLHRLCVQRNDRHAGLQLEWDEEDVFFRSDHFQFARRGVPIAFFFTGFHPDYHRPSDTVDKIDFDKLRRIATYVYDIAFELATADGRPLVDPERWQQLRRQLRGRAPAEPAAPLRPR